MYLSYLPPPVHSSLDCSPLGGCLDLSCVWAKGPVEIYHVHTDNVVCFNQSPTSCLTLTKLQEDNGPRWDVPKGPSMYFSSSGSGHVTSVKLTAY